MHKMIITGCGTNVGKTVVSAIITTALSADYWKPIESGCVEEPHLPEMRRLVPSLTTHIYPSAYSLEAPLSPHHAARLENVQIDPAKIILPNTTRPLVIETAGGVLVPLTCELLTLDHFLRWNALWIIVSRHYLGSINHTLLTIEALKNRQVNILGIVFNGDPNPDSEQAILQQSNLSCVGRLLPEPNLNCHVIKEYADQWKPSLIKRLPQP